jgi:microsomal epoxide hydrolase
MRVEPQPYRLNIQDDVLDDLRERLARTRWPDEIPESGWRYGSNLAFMRRLTERWRDGFDWRAQEARLNASTSSRCRSTASSSTSSTSPASGPTHCRVGVPAPSLPGFTLSFEPDQPPLGIVAMADLFARLMTEVLGYPRVSRSRR